MVSPDGGEAWELTESGTDVGQFRWSNDSRQIAFMASPSENKAGKDRKEKYGEYTVFEKDYRQKQLWSVDVAEAVKKYRPLPAKQLMAGLSINVINFAWSPDSTQIAFAAAKNSRLVRSLHLGPAHPKGFAASRNE